MRKRKILVVEDNPMNMELFSDLLEINGYEVLKAMSGLEMFEIIGSVSIVPDLILMDIQIPDVDGLTLTKRLKGNPLTRDIPIIALTAHAMKGDREKTLEAGCIDYIPKPIDIKEFINKISKFL
ncbi:MAG: response regulator [Deltaproteobacteria bacterium]|nr:response regulator [Deltaproteobacteria bacterium]